MKKHLAAARESVACLPDSKERQAALTQIRYAQERAAGLPEDPEAHALATNAYIKSLEQRVEQAEHGEAYCLRACNVLQARVAELMGLKREAA